MVYSDLKTHTDFINAVRTLKKSSLEFFEIVDKPIATIRDAEGVVYNVRPVIEEGDTSIDTEFEIVATPDPDTGGVPPPPPSNLPAWSPPPIPQEDRRRWRRRRFRAPEEPLSLWSTGSSHVT